MSTDLDPKVADEASADEPIDQAMEFNTVRYRGLTHVTVTNSKCMSSFGTRSPDFFFGLVRQAANAVAPKGRDADEDGIKFMFAVIKNSKPRDEIEAMLLTQMAATHVAVMSSANRLSNAESPQGQEIAERTYNKLARTFAAQIEAFQHYRTKNDAKVIVQTVSVSDGGQAIVGNVTGRGHETARKQGAPVTPEVTDTRQSPMETVGEPQRAPVALKRR